MKANSNNTNRTPSVPAWPIQAGHPLTTEYSQATDIPLTDNFDFPACPIVQRANGRSNIPFFC